jgi:hypothetical protein
MAQVGKLPAFSNERLLFNVASIFLVRPSSESPRVPQTKAPHLISLFPVESRFMNVIHISLEIHLVLALCYRDGKIMHDLCRHSCCISQYAVSCLLSFCALLKWTSGISKTLKVFPQTTDI